MFRFRSVLIIDNDPVYIYLTKREIRKANIASEIYTASNGENALDFLVDYFKEHRILPEVILTDLRMPVMDGLEFLRRLNRLPFYNSKEVIVATVTSSENYDELEKVKNEGVNYLFPKPMLGDYIKYLKLIKISRVRPSLYERIFQIRNVSLLKAS